MAVVTLAALAARFAAMPDKFELCVQRELKRVGVRVRDTAVRKFGHYQPEIGEWPAWAKLADSTIEAKARAGGGEDPLIGHYPSSHHSVWPTTLRQSIEFVVEGLFVKVGTADPLGEYHEFGTPHIPPRPFLRPAAFENQEYFEDRMAIAMAAAIGLL